MSEIKLLSCPFCGGEVEISAEQVDAIRESYMFHCDSCDMNTYFDFCDNEKEAIEKWNTRKSIDRIVEQLEEKADEANDSISTEFHHPQYHDGREDGFREAIEIVKVGGENEIN